MTFKISEDMLEEKLEALESARSWRPRVIAKLESFIRSEDDFCLFRINPIQFANTKKISEDEAIDLFLHGRKVGLFRMDWQLLCEGCADVVESFGSLDKVDSHFFCNICESDREASMDDYIEISFTISPSVRKIRCHDPACLSAEDYILRYRFSQNACMEDGKRFVNYLKECAQSFAFLEPGEAKSFEMEISSGLLLTNVGLTFRVSDGSKSNNQRFSHKILENTEKHFGTLVPGVLIFELENRSPDRVPSFILNPPSRPSFTFDTFFSGKKLLTSQTFRDLFESDRVVTTDGIGIKDITFVFTDLKGSTALYERIGDLKAFSLVRQHFDYLRKAINQCHGAIVKTIGDAVMAAFFSPTDALNAALSMLKEIDHFNAEYGEKVVILKIGMHRGHSIAVTLNDRLDYFGQTVNIASRVQKLADANEIYITDEIYQFPGMRELLGEKHIEPHMAKLKGIAKDFKVYRL